MSTYTNSSTTIYLRPDVTPEQVVEALKPVLDYFPGMPKTGVSTLAMDDILTLEGVTVLEGSVAVNWVTHELDWTVQGECGWSFSDDIEKALAALVTLCATPFHLRWQSEDDQQWRDYFYGPSKAATRKFEFEFRMENSIQALEPFCPTIRDVLTAVARLAYEPK